MLPNSAPYFGESAAGCACWRLRGRPRCSRSPAGRASARSDEEALRDGAIIAADMDQREPRQGDRRGAGAPGLPDDTGALIRSRPYRMLLVLAALIGVVVS